MSHTCKCTVGIFIVLSKWMPRTLRVPETFYFLEKPKTELTYYCTVYCLSSTHAGASIVIGRGWTVRTQTVVAQTRRCYASHKYGGHRKINSTMIALLNTFLYLGYLCLPTGGVEANPLPQERRLTLDIVVPDYDEDDPIMKDLAIPDNAAHIGMWTPLVPWPLVSIHCAVLPNGKVVTYGRNSILREVLIDISSDYFCAGTTHTQFAFSCCTHIFLRFTNR